MGVSCSADRNLKAKITRDGIFLEKLETNPGRFIPAAHRRLMPEIGFYHSIDQPAFNGSVSIPGPNGIQGLATAPNRFNEFLVASDVILHF